MLDTAVQLETPEGIEISLHPAGLVARGLAFLIDEVIRWLIIFAAFAAGSLLGVFGLGLGLIVTFVTYWLYGVLFEVFNNGQTPGKKMQGLQVVHDDATPIKLQASLLRNLLLWVDLLPMAYAAGIVSICLTQRFRRIGDLAAGTMVIYRSDPRGGQRVGHQGADQSDGIVETASDIVPRPTPFPLSQEEQGVVVDYLERSDLLSSARREELANILGTSLGGPADTAETLLKQMALGLKGGQVQMPENAGVGNGV